jgi:hypothetical protein
MNIFEQDAFENDKSVQMSAILIAWGTFKTTVLHLMEYYKNVNPEGKKYGADVSEPNDTSIIIVCPRGQHPEEMLASLMITIRAGIAKGSNSFSIECSIEKWKKRPIAAIAPHMDGHPHKMTFVLDVGHMSLIYQGRQFTPDEAASELLKVALLKK